MKRTRLHVNAVDEKDPTKLVEGILCDFFEPDSVSGTPSVKLFANKAQADALMGFYGIVLQGSLSKDDGKNSTVFWSKGYVGSYQSHHWADDIVDVEVDYIPMEVRHSLTFPKTKMAEQPRPTASYWISPCRLISPLLAIGQSYDGNVTVERNGLWSESLPFGPKILIDKHFEFVTQDDGVIAMPSHNAGVVNISGDPELEIVEYLNLVNLFLEIVTFAYRQRVTCFGWDFSSGTEITKHFLLNRNGNIGSGESETHQLIQEWDFPEFYSAVCTFMGTSGEVELFRSALRSFPSSNTIETETSFLRLFYAIEVLASIFPGNKGSSFFGRSAWDKFRHHMKNEIFGYCSERNLTVPPQKIADKLPELNRPSFSDAFGDFQAYYNLEFDSLWPLTCNRGGLSLQQIRNKLTHGHKFGGDLNEALIEAHDSLWRIAELAMLSVIGWPLKRSTLRVPSKDKPIPEVNWEIAREKISRSK